MRTSDSHDHGPDEDRVLDDRRGRDQRDRDQRDREAAAVDPDAPGTSLVQPDGDAVEPNEPA